MHTQKLIALLVAFGVSATGQNDAGQAPRFGLDLYRARPIPAISLENSKRIGSLMRDGQLYLSLDDAIALALENNLDVEMQRISPSLADTDVLRARGGGILRGITLSSALPPVGVGGPASPLLNSATPGFTVSGTIASNVTGTAFLGTGTTNLTITPATFSTGPALPPFDPNLVGSLNWQHLSTPQSNPFVTGANVLVAKSLTSNVSLVQGLGPGTQIGGSFNTTSQENNSIRSTLNPYNNAGFGLTLTQPLLRGFGSNVNRRFIRIAQNNRKISDIVFRQQAIDTVSGVIRLYYDLVSLIEDVRVKQQTVDLARKLFEDNKVQVEQGTLAPIELVRAQALIAAGQQDLANSQGLEREQELIVKTVLTRRGTADPAIRAAHVVPTTPIPALGTESVEPIQDLLDQAFKNRPDLASADVQLSNSNIALEGSRNNLLPDVSLVASASNSGLAGEQNALLPAGGIGPSRGFIGGFGGALEQIFRRNYPTYGVGIQLTLPLRNRIAQADYVRDELQLRQTQVRRQQLENQARLEVEDALIALERSRAAYQAAADSARYQQESLAAEQEKFAVGLSTTFLIIQYQSQLAQARSTEVAARGSYAKARVALDRALGLTLDRNNVSVDEAYRGQISRPPSAPPPPAPATPQR